MNALGHLNKKRKEDERLYNVPRGTSQPLRLIALNDYFIKFLFSSGGAFIALIVAYYTVGKDVSFIKGQMLLIMERLKQLDKVFESQGKFEKDLLDKKYSLDSAHDKIRDLQQRKVV